MWLLLTGCLASPTDDPVRVFDAVWDDYDAMYGGFHQRDVDWDEGRAIWRPIVQADPTEDGLWEALTGLLASTDDGHIRLVAPGREVFDANRVYRERTMLGTFDADLARTYLTDVDTGPWDAYVRGTLAPEVAYVWFPFIDDNTFVIDTIVDEDPSTLVVDLRHSHGGAFNFAMMGMGRLVDEDVFAFRTRSRNGPDHDDYDPWFEWRFPHRDSPWEGRILVLTDRETISATERVLMFLQQLPNTTTIGLPSNGSLATAIGREAPNGWNYQMPVQEVEDPNGVVFEGIGLPVDVEAINDPADVAAGRDEVLELAREMATAP